MRPAGQSGMSSITVQSDDNSIVGSVTVAG